MPHGIARANCARQGSLRHRRIARAAALARGVNTRTLLGNPYARRVKPVSLQARPRSYLPRTASRVLQGGTSQVMGSNHANHAPRAFSRPAMLRVVRSATMDSSRTTRIRVPAETAHRVRMVGRARDVAARRRGTAVLAAPASSSKAVNATAAYPVITLRVKTQKAARSAKQKHFRATLARVSASNTQFASRDSEHSSRQALRKIARAWSARRAGSAARRIRGTASFVPRTNFRTLRNAASATSSRHAALANTKALHPAPHRIASAPVVWQASPAAPVTSATASRVVTMSFSPIKDAVSATSAPSVSLASTRPLRPVPPQTGAAPSASLVPLAKRRMAPGARHAPVANIKPRRGRHRAWHAQRAKRAMPISAPSLHRPIAKIVLRDSSCHATARKHARHAPQVFFRGLVRQTALGA